MKEQIIYKGIKISLVFYFLFSSIKSSAQTCTGGLGEIAWKQTFGKGPNPGNSLPAGKTSYLYTPDACPAEGYYTLVNSIPSCFANSWDSGIICCTVGDTDGYMMLINASVNTGDVYVDTATNLCGSTNYQFNAVVVNISLPSACGGAPLRPWLTFSVETTAGVKLATLNTGNVPESSSGSGPIDYSVFFYTPPGVTTAVIRVTSNTAGGCGNDFALDNIYIGPCGPFVEAGIKDMLGASLDLCVGNLSSAELSGKIGAGYHIPDYQWQTYNGADWIDIPGANFIDYGLNPATGAGNYKYRLTAAEEGNIASSHCRVESNEVDINIHNPSMAGTASSNSPVCENSTVNLIANGGSSYRWTGPAGFSSTDENPSFIATPGSAGQYAVIVNDAFGCQSTVSTKVNTIPAPTVAVTSTKNICLGDSVSLLASGGNVYAWLPVSGLSDPAASNPIARPVQTTVYTVKVADNNNCTDTATVLVVVNTKPIVSAGDDKFIIKGQSVTLDGSIKDLSNINFSWSASPSLDNAAILNPLVNPLTNTDYILMASSALGCGEAADTVLVTVYNGLSIPNAFSPNGDGHNDSWHIRALQAYPNALVSVYNRNGQRIFEASAGSRDWDGTYKRVAQPPGAYVYVIDLKNNKPVIKGIVVLVR